MSLPSSKMTTASKSAAAPPLAVKRAATPVVATPATAESGTPVALDRHAGATVAVVVAVAVAPPVPLIVTSTGNVPAVA